MKECEKPGCKSPRVFFNKAQGLKIWIECRMNYYSQLIFTKIPDSTQATLAIDNVAMWLKEINNHAQTYPIEDLHKGFKGELSEFVRKMEEIKKRLREVEDKDLIEEIENVEKDIYELKKQIDSSEMMHNFAFHRIQLKMDWVSKGSMNEEIQDDTQVKRLLTLAKESITHNYERKYDESIKKRNEELKMEYEEKYRTQFDEYKAQIEELKAKIEIQGSTLDNQKEEIIASKEETKKKDKKIEILEENCKKKEMEIELITTYPSSVKILFEHYKAKAG